MIVTLTANPSLDRTVSLPAALVPGEVQLATGAREDAGGKGINVARVLSQSGVDALAVLPLATDDPFGSVLDGTRIRHRAVPVAGRARANLTITDPAGVTTKLNLPGAALHTDERRALVDATVAASVGADWLVLAGSVPPGAGDDFYVDVIRAVRASLSHPPRIAVDTSGAALAAVVELAQPDLIKPNEDELAEITGVQIDPTQDAVRQVADIAGRLVPGTVGAALVTLGSAGAVLVTPDGAWSAGPPAIRAASTVGAGDSSLAGYLLADVAGREPADRLENAIRYGAAAASLPGTLPPGPDDLPSGEVVVRPL